MCTRGGKISFTFRIKVQVVFRDLSSYALKLVKQHIATLLTTLLLARETVSIK